MRNDFTRQVRCRFACACLSYEAARLAAVQPIALPANGMGSGSCHAFSLRDGAAQGTAVVAMIHPHGRRFARLVNRMEW